MVDIAGDFPDLPDDAARPSTLANNSLLWTSETKRLWKHHRQDLNADVYIIDFDTFAVLPTE